MKHLIKIGLIVCLLFMTSNLFAQKFGHLNSTELLSLMPASKSADKELETFSVQLDNQYQQLLGNFETEYRDIQQQIQAGLLTPNQIQEKEQYFQQKQVEVQQFEADAQQKILQKREAVYGPILQQAQDAINSVAAEGGYTYIFDTSMNVILYAQPGDDVTGQVRSKLGF